MPVTIWDHLKNITTTKGKFLGDEGFNNWLINKFLSMNQNYVEVVNEVQKNTWQMSPKNLYALYKDLIPKQYVYLKYIKASNKKEYNLEQLESIKTYYQISSREAKEYIDMLPKEEVEQITRQLNG